MSKYARFWAITKNYCACQNSFQGIFPQWRMDSPSESETKERAEIKPAPYFQKFIDHVNKLLDSDFPAVKEQFFRGVWKLGVGVSSADSTQVCFQLYVILPGDPAILVSGIQTPKNKPPNVVTWRVQDGKTVQFQWKSRQALKSPKEEAENFVFDHFSEILRRKRLPLFGKRLAIEYLFWFVDNFGASI